VYDSIDECFPLAHCIHFPLQFFTERGLPACCGVDDTTRVSPILPLSINERVLLFGSPTFLGRLWPWRFLSYPVLRCSLWCVRTFGLWCVRTFDLPSDRTGHSQFRSNDFPEATVAYQSSLVPI
jgi:hypothetical protein